MEIRSKNECVVIWSVCYLDEHDFKNTAIYSFKPKRKVFV